MQLRRLGTGAALLSLFLVACDAGDAPPAAPEQVPASRGTTEATGITLWEVAQDGDRYQVIGRGLTGDVRADFTSTYNPAMCGPGGSTATPVIVKTSANGGGIKSVDCKSDIVTNTMDSTTQGIFDRLSEDLHDRLGPAAAREGGNDATASTTATTIGYCPPALCGCPAYTQTKCFGVSLWCKQHNGDCTSGSWYPCGGCFGFKW